MEGGEGELCATALTDGDGGIAATTCVAGTGDTVADGELGGILIVVNDVTVFFEKTS